jgi:hypothetical protein
VDLEEKEVVYALSDSWVRGWLAHLGAPLDRWLPPISNCHLQGEYDDEIDRKLVLGKHYHFVSAVDYRVLVRLYGCDCEFRLNVKAGKIVQTALIYLY